MPIHSAGPGKPTEAKDRGTITATASAGARSALSALENASTEKRAEVQGAIALRPLTRTYWFALQVAAGTKVGSGKHVG